jgi:hypothetical protein
MRTKKCFIVVVAFALASLLVVGAANAFEGRMYGMANPSGLVEDESDFLIHPSKVAEGKGVKYYFDYRFNYRDVKWDYTLKGFNPSTGALLTDRQYRSSGKEYGHDGLLGVTFPLWSGRMGLLLQYEGRRLNYEGKEDELYYGTPYYHEFSFDSNFNTFSVRVPCGFPVSSRFKLGGEVQLAYRRDKSESLFNEDVGGGGYEFIINDIFGQEGEETNLFPFLFPYDSMYYEALIKGSLDGSLGAAKISFTARGGLIFSGDNKLKYNNNNEFGADMDGGVEGWRAGGDLWIRYPLKNGLSVPLVFRTEYQKKTRDGKGPGTYGYDPAFNTFDYEQSEKTFQVEAGGGVDKDLGRGTRIAGGLYYAYLRDRNDFSVTRFFGGLKESFNHTGYPDQTQHRLTMRLSGEKELSSSVALRMGLNLFYGWVEEDYKFTEISAFNNYYIKKTSLRGSNWGLNASVGSTLRLSKSVKLEPFIGGGYRKLDLSGDGYKTAPAFPANLEMDKSRKEWLALGGLSILF